MTLKHTIFQAGLCGVFGALATIAVAAGGRARVEKVPRLALGAIGTGGGAPSAWPSDAPRGWPSVGKPEFRGSAFAVDYEEWRLVEAGGFWKMEVVRAGLPFRALEGACGYRYSGGRQTESFSRGLVGPFPATPLGVLGYIGPIRRDSVPYSPLVPGFLLDTAIFGACAFIVWTTPRPLRRMVRRVRGRCLRCNYELGGLPPGSRCPECSDQPKQTINGAVRAREVSPGP